METLWRAVEAFFEGLAAVHWQPLAAAVACHVAKLLARARAWRNTLGAAFPSAAVPYRVALGAYVGGVGVNALLPARAGDLVRLYLAKRRIRDASYTALGSSLLVEVPFDLLASTLLLAWALQLGVLPGLDVLPELPAVDWLWLFGTPLRGVVAALVALVAGFVLGLWLARHAVAFRTRVAQGVRILRTPRRYLVRVATWQAVDWALRLATLFFFLRAFGLTATAHNAALAQVAQSVSTALPLTPAGIGTEQALLVYVFRGDAAASTLLSFSVGMKIVLIAVNALAGLAAIGLTLRTLRVRSAVRAARADRTREEAAPAGSPPGGSVRSGEDRR